MGSQANSPCHNLSQTGWCSIYLPRKDGRLSWPQVVGYKPVMFTKLPQYFTYVFQHKTNTENVNTYKVLELMKPCAMEHLREQICGQTSIDKCTPIYCVLCVVYTTTSTTEYWDENAVVEITVAAQHVPCQLNGSDIRTAERTQKENGSIAGGKQSRCAELFFCRQFFFQITTIFRFSVWFTHIISWYEI